MENKSHKAPKDRLLRYFELESKKKLSKDEREEKARLQVRLLDDMDMLCIPDELETMQQRFINEAIELMCGPYAIIDTGSQWDVIDTLLQCALPKLSGKERLRIADLIGGRIAVAAWPSRKEYAKKFGNGR